MNHPARRLLWAYLDRETLTSKQRQAVAGLLAQDPSARAELEAMRVLGARIAGQTPAPVAMPADLQKKIMERIRAGAKAKDPRRGPGAVTPWRSHLLGGLVILGLLGGFMVLDVTKAKIRTANHAGRKRWARITCEFTNPARPGGCEKSTVKYEPVVLAGRHQHLAAQSPGNSQNPSGSNIHKDPGVRYDDSAGVDVSPRLTPSAAGENVQGDIYILGKGRVRKKAEVLKRESAGNPGTRE